MRNLLLIPALILTLTAGLTAATVRIFQTNAAGDNIHLIDPATNKVVAVIGGIEVPHGAAVLPDGSRFYFSNEADHTLDIVDGKTHKVDQAGTAQRPSQQHFDQQGRAPHLCRDSLAAGRCRRDRYCDRHPRQEHPDQGRHSQHVRLTGRQARRRRLDRRDELSPSSM